jgi:hypothetical protein
MKLASLTHCVAASAWVASALNAGAVASPFGNDLAAARAKAQAEHRDVLVSFTGSDWCGWCLILEKEVFLKPEFNAEAGKHFELVQLDFPSNKSKQDPEVAARYQAWKKELKSSSFPDILLLDEKGKVFGRMNYREGGVKPFLAHLEAQRQGRVQRDAAMAAADKVQGVERARHLDEALVALHNDDVMLTYYGDVIGEIMRLDATGEAGLRPKYEAVFTRKKAESEIDRLCGEQDGAVMLAKLKEYASRSGLPAETRQYALYMAACVACERVIKDPAQGLVLIEEAIALAPESQLVKESLQDAKTRLERKVNAKPAVGSGRKQ